MAKNFIGELVAPSENWTIIVRIVRLWENFKFEKPSELQSIDMLLLDEQGDAIHAYITKNVCGAKKSFFVEGSVISMKYFRIVKAVGTYRPIQRSNKLMILMNTIVKSVVEEAHTIPRYYFEFPSPAQLSKRKGDKTVLSNVIGRLVAVGLIEKVMSAGQPTDIRRIHLAVNGADEVRATLWRGCINQIDVDVASAMTPVIIAINSVYVSEFNGKLSLSTTNSSRLYIDIDIPDRQAIIESDGVERPIQVLHTFQPSNEDLVERMNTGRKTIAELLAVTWSPEFKECTFTVRATIRSVDESYGWYYIGCPVCSKIISKSEGQFHCRSCNCVTKHPLTRYKVQVKVYDGTAEASFTIFNADIASLIKTTAFELVSKEPSQSGQIPDQILSLERRTLIFEVKVTDYNVKEGYKNYTVSKAFDPSCFGESSQVYAPSLERPADQEKVGNLNIHESTPIDQVEPGTSSAITYNQLPSSDKINEDSSKKRKQSRVLAF